MICLNSASHTKNVSITAGCLHLAEMLKQFFKAKHGRAGKEDWKSLNWLQKLSTADSRVAETADCYRHKSGAKLA